MTTATLSYGGELVFLDGLQVRAAQPVLRRLFTHTLEQALPYGPSPSEPDLTRLAVRLLQAEYPRLQLLVLTRPEPAEKGRVY